MMSWQVTASVVMGEGVDSERHFRKKKHCNWPLDFLVLTRYRNRRRARVCPLDRIGRKLRKTSDLLRGHPRSL